MHALEHAAPGDTFIVGSERLAAFGSEVLRDLGTTDVMLVVKQQSTVGSGQSSEQPPPAAHRPVARRPDDPEVQAALRRLSSEIIRSLECIEEARKRRLAAPHDESI